MQTSRDGWQDKNANAFLGLGSSTPKQHPHFLPSGVWLARSHQKRRKPHQALRSATEHDAHFRPDTSVDPSIDAAQVSIEAVSAWQAQGLVAGLDAHAAEAPWRGTHVWTEYSSCVGRFLHMPTRSVRVGF